MNEIQIFKNNEFGEIRTIIDKKGNPWFCLKDVCDILEIGNSRDVKKRLELDGVDTIDVVVNSGLGEQKVQMTFINESNLYDCIFQSRKEEAKPFRKWVTSEILPSVRKYGMYAKDELLDNPDLLLDVITKYKQEREKTKVLEQKIEEDKKKVEFYDDVTDSKHTCDMQTVAKTLNFKEVGRNKLFEILRNEKILQYDNKPYQRYVDAGWFRLIESKYNDYVTGDVKISFKTVVFQKGVQKISSLLKDLGYSKVVE